ncbi:MAG: hypothetical protein ABJA34_01165 [Pseudonocardiales bacterium]
MRKALPALTASFVIAASLIGLTASQATVSGVPSECTATKIDTWTKSLTCTSRPPTQKWLLNLLCMSMAGLEDVAHGNVVAANGRSTASCTQGGIASGTVFVMDG